MLFHWPCRLETEEPPVAVSRPHGLDLPTFQARQTSHRDWKAESRSRNCPHSPSQHQPGSATLIMPLSGIVSSSENWNSIKFGTSQRKRVLHGRTRPRIIQSGSHKIPESFVGGLSDRLDISLLEGTRTSFPPSQTFHCRRRCWVISTGRRTYHRNISECLKDKYEDQAKSI